MQLLFYLYKLKKAGILAKGELLIPKEKKKFEVELTPLAEKELLQAIDDIKKIIELPDPPKPLPTKFCKKCSYYEFCFA